MGNPSRSEPLGGSALDPSSRAAGSDDASWVRAYAANSEWMRNQPPRSSRETKRLERSSSASTAEEPVRSSTASQSSAVNSPRTAAPWRNDRWSSSSAARTSLLRYSATKR